ncbi:hypothetical protein K435DRAFT_855114 [Dendrothele bispora CBS 962.96]|uniref:Uncharacterized protein n=1 Tax=Dendrothele bispora (strain CBS 962.96) TaxID=1314807 RepID=A0A4S8MDC0_DENBC|nr:hypothetical protein K435DRAFT_855114 [Dendrothele bispora CBS 962.96]
MSSVTANSPDTVDNATIVQADQAGGSATTVTNVDVPATLASDTTPATTEQDDQPLRSVSPNTCTNMILAHTVQMLHNSSHSVFNNGRFNNIGRDSNIYITNNNISSTDLAALISLARSSAVSQDAMPSQPEHVNDGDMSTPSTAISSTDLAALISLARSSVPAKLEHVNHGDTRAGGTSTASNEANGSATGIQTGITTPRRVQREPSTSEDQPDCSGPHTRGKEDQQATRTADAGDQTSKSG